MKDIDQPLEDLDEELDQITSDRSSSWQGSLLPGLFLIGLGTFFLINNFTDFQLDNWWALFILIPAVSNFSEAIAAMRQDGA